MAWLAVLGEICKMAHRRIGFGGRSYHELVHDHRVLPQRGLFVNRTMRVLGSRSMTVLMLAWLVFYAAVHLWPAAWWINVRSISVGPATEWSSVPVLIDRDIHRQFTATRYTTVRRWSEYGWAEYCTSRMREVYLPDTVPPNDLTLDVWTNGRCSTLQAGRYSVDTTWVIHGYGPFPNKQLGVVSNIFEVKS